MNNPVHNWDIANQRYLSAMMEAVRKQLEAYSGDTKESDGAEIEKQALADVSENFKNSMHGFAYPAALDKLVHSFGLSAFERSLLVLCAGVELDSKFGSLVAKIQGNGYLPTFGLALATLPEAHWSALSPAAPLRYWRLIQINTDQAISKASLKIDEHILHYLVGIQQLDEKLTGVIQSFDFIPTLVPSHQELCNRILQSVGISKENKPFVIHLSGDNESDRKDVAGNLSTQLGLRPYITFLYALPATIKEVIELARLWNREAALKSFVLILDATDLDIIDKQRVQLTNSFIDAIQSPLVILGAEMISKRNHSIKIFEVKKPAITEQYSLWKDRLSILPFPDDELKRLIGQFSFSANTIEIASKDFLNDCNGHANSISQNEKGKKLWQSCCGHARLHITELAQRIDPIATMDGLILPELQKERLRELIMQVKHRSKVYDDWGFAQSSSRGLGITAVFSGESGTGKTMASEVVAKALDLDLYRIDLSQVVSKYIGETEKNLKKIFDAAEEGGAILLFDEADALFGKRSDVKDSHDRHANVEVSYLLQRMEAYRGLAILTTNMKQAMDKAWMRRIRFIIQFPFPSMEQRAAIWQSIFPIATPTTKLDIAKLARLNIAGGNIKNIAMNAAFIAAETNGPVTMLHVKHALKCEYEKMEKPLTNTEMAQLQ